MLIPCPHCGPRDSGEFTYGGDASRTRPALDAPQAEWCDYLYQRENPRGLHREYWQHTGGCRAIAVVSRDVTTHEVHEDLRAEPPRVLDPAEAVAVPEPAE